MRVETSKISETPDLGQAGAIAANYSLKAKLVTAILFCVMCKLRLCFTF